MHENTRMQLLSMIVLRVCKITNKLVKQSLRVTVYGNHFVSEVVSKEKFVKLSNGISYQVGWLHVKIRKNKLNNFF